MQALVVYESMYGNTHAVAIDIAAGLRATHEVTLVPVTRATPELVAAADLIVAGSPTHMHGMPSVASRRTATETARKQGSGLNLDPDADGPGLRAWLERLDAENTLAASFDTRISGVPVLTGRASRGIARLLSSHGCRSAGSAGKLPRQQAEHAAQRRDRPGPFVGSADRQDRPRGLRLRQAVMSRGNVQVLLLPGTLSAPRGTRGHGARTATGPRVRRASSPP